jgi:hypothetical protein
MAGDWMAGMDSRRGRQARAYRHQAEGEELIMPSDHDYPTLYQVQWCEDGKTKKSPIKSALSAFKTMEKLLARGIPSWMVPVPWEDDDVPF